MLKGRYHVLLAIPPTYGNGALPLAYVLDPTVRPAAPHRYQDGSLCLDHTGAFTRKSTLVTLLAWVSVWLVLYEDWLVGDWHVHPMWLPELSATDRRTARTILREEAKSRAHLVLLLGTSAPGEKPIVLGFKAAITARGLAIEGVAVRRVADDARVGGPACCDLRGELRPLMTTGKTTQP